MCTFKPAVFVHFHAGARTPAGCPSFAPGECAQVDWGTWGSVTVGSTRRQLSFFVMVLCYSRMLYVEFTLAQTLEHFLACHQRAFEFFQAVPAGVMVDNAKTAVLQHPPLGEPVSIILTTNKAFKSWPAIFNNDATLASAVLDRLLHHAETVIIEGKSFRMKGQAET